MNIEIRDELPQDYASITDLIIKAFEGKPYAEGDEADVVLRLRSASALTLSLVAVFEGQVVGQAAFSRAVSDRGVSNWFALGPIAVLSEHQSKGIGSAMLHEGFRRLQAVGAAGVILVGDPRYYTRFGFELSPANCPDDQPPEYFMIKRFTQVFPTGKLGFHPGFYS